MTKIEYTIIWLSVLLFYFSYSEKIKFLNRIIMSYPWDHIPRDIIPYTFIVYLTHSPPRLLHMLTSTPSPEIWWNGIWGIALLADCLPSMHNITLAQHKPGVAGLESQSYPQFHSKLQARLEYLLSCDGKKARQKRKLDEMWLAKQEGKIPPKLFPMYSNGHLLTIYRNTHSFGHFSRNSIKEESTSLQFYPPEP